MVLNSQRKKRVFGIAHLVLFVKQADYQQIIIE
jgi:hypothetical protein